MNRAIPDSITLTLVDGVKIVVPDSLNLITPYVLKEQQDWFEDEIRFLRRLLEPGQKVVDIGANYGTYTLTMAKAVGAAGFVWAFEPASSCAALLAQGVAANGYRHVIVEQSAVSCECGTGCLGLNDHSELNALVRPENAPKASETVSLVTLDECLQRYGWKDIDFVKIDAEGEESNILKGGRRFLAEQSPLIQYEVRAAMDFRLELVRDFAALGFRSYRLVPALNLLVPFGADSTPDPYLLNLFCCKSSRAAQLAAKGFLSDSEPDSSLSVTENLNQILIAANNYTWRTTIARLPYGVQLAGAWENTPATEDRLMVDDALAYYAISRDGGIAPAMRVGALAAGFRLLKYVCDKHPQHLRLASLARVAHAYGARSVAVNALQQLAASILQKNPIDVSEPFLAPAERFDPIAPGETIANWVLASVVEQLERLGSPSSFYAGNAARQRLELIGSLGFASAEMERRLHLVKARFDVVR